MELKWLQDVLALAECESLTAAAERRGVTQPAFSRRLRAFENWLGVELVDRSRKTSRVSPAVADRIESVRALARDFYRLRNDIRAAERSRSQLVFIAQHTLTMTYLPGLISRLRPAMALTTLRLRAANMDDCYTVLLRHEADILIGYRTRGIDLPFPAAAFDSLRLSGDELVPMVAPGLVERVTRELDARGPLTVIGYPSEVFFGVVFHRSILPALARRQTVHVACETALAPGVLELTLEGLGIGWLPRSLAAPHAAQGRLVALPPELGVVPLDIVAMRRSASRDTRVDAAWRALGEAAEERRTAESSAGG